MGPKAQNRAQKTDVVEDDPEEGAAGGQPVTIPPLPVEMDSITSMLQRCLEFQCDLSERWDKEPGKQDMRWRQMQVQMNNLRDDLEQQQRGSGSQPQRNSSLQQEEGHASQRSARTEFAGRGWGQAAVPRLEEGDDIEQYLTTFERLAVAYQWPEVEWAVRLIPHLTGKARAAYVAKAAEESSDYKKVKEAILAKYEINEEVYRQRFREPDIHPNESPKEFYNRLKDLYDKWIQPAKRTKEQIGEILILEQFYRSLSPELRVWVKERDPESARNATELVETFLSARRGSKNYRFEAPQKSTTARGKPLGSGGGGGPRESESVRPLEKSVAPVKSKSTTKPVCFYCGQEGHIKPERPARKAKAAYLCTVPRPCLSERCVVRKQQVTAVKINGNPAQALLDTGSEQTLIHPSLVQREGSLGKPVLDISCVHGDQKAYPMTVVYLEVAGQTFLLSVGVVDRLAHQIILGQDLPILQELVQSCKPVNIVTRSQGQIQRLEGRGASGDQAGSAEDAKGPDEPIPQFPAQVDVEFQTTAQVSAEEDLNVLSELPFFEEFLPDNFCKMRKSKRQKRQEKMAGTVRTRSELTEPEICDAGKRCDFVQLQKEDESLQDSFRKAVVVQQGQVAGEGYFLRDQVLYYKAALDDRERLVVPQRLREQVLKLGHSIPWAGHLGAKKTLDRIADRCSLARVEQGRAGLLSVLCYLSASRG
ncbi:uncharacterized protein LOC144459818 [Epinephelus lanceolatus]